MKLTNREKTMLVILTVVMMVVGYYYLLLEPQMKEISRLTEVQDELKMKIENSATNEISIKIFRERYEKLLISVENETKRFFPDILQDKIIILLNELIEKSNIISNSESFADVEIGPITITKKPIPAIYPLEDLVNEYRESVENTPKTNGIQNEENKSEDDRDSTLSYLENLSVSLQINGSYQQIMNFIKLIEELERTIIINNVSFSVDEGDIISTGMNLVFYAIPKIHIQDEEYINWTIKNKYGKENPFEELENFLQEEIIIEEESLN